MPSAAFGTRSRRDGRPVGESVEPMRLQIHAIEFNAVADPLRRNVVTVGDRGDVLDGVSVEAKGREIFNMILRVASGERSKSEQLGYGGAEFVPWQIGATI